MIPAPAEAARSIKNATARKMMEKTMPQPLYDAHLPALPLTNCKERNPAQKGTIYCNMLLFPACQNGFALKKLGGPPGQEDRYRDQDDGGNDCREYG